MNNTQMLIEKTEQMFAFLKEHTYHSHINKNEGYGSIICYHFSEEVENKQKEGIIRIPLDENNILSFSFNEYEKIGKDKAYLLLDTFNAPFEQTPAWFQQVYDEIKVMIEKRDRIRSIVNLKK